MHKERNWFKKGALIATMVGLGSVIGYWYFEKKMADTYTIYAFNDDERDIQEIDTLFHENFYWMTTRDAYDVRAMLTRRTSEFTNPNVNNNMEIYVMREKPSNKLIGFVSFFKVSFYKGQILFVLVNDAFRGKRYGEKLTRYALDKMKEMGMIKATLFTRLDNTAARKLYERMGFTETSRVDNVGLYYDIYL